MRVQNLDFWPISSQFLYMWAPEGAPQTTMRVTIDVYLTSRKKISSDTLGRLFELVPFGNALFCHIIFAKYTASEASNQLFSLQWPLLEFDFLQEKHFYFFCRVARWNIQDTQKCQFADRFQVNFYIWRHQKAPIRLPWGWQLMFIWLLEKKSDWILLDDCSN